MRYTGIVSPHRRDDGADRTEATGHTGFRRHATFRIGLTVPAVLQPSSRRSPRFSMTKERLIPLIVATALFMENMDSTVIATSLPAIAADIGTSPLTLKLAI